MEMKNFVCLNDGSGTKVDVRTGAESAIDLTLVSDSLAGICSWQVVKETTIGSDHYPIMTMIEFSIEKRDVRGVKQWCFRDADWDTFRLVSDQEMQKIDMNVGVDELNYFICKAVLEVASRVMKRKDGRGEKKIVPWWTQECDKVIKYRNRAFKTLKNNHSFQNFIEYKRLQAKVKRTIKSAKRDFWRGFCNSVGRETRIQNIWSMIRRMNGMKRECDYPILRDGDIIAVTDEEKANVLAKTFVKVLNCGSGNVSEEGRRGKDMTIAENRGLLDLVGDTDNSLNILFTKTELHRVLQKSKLSAPGKDQVCYTMLNQLSESAKDLLLGLYNRVWEGGKLPQSWKEAVVVPIRKPGKDVTNPGNFRPIALTSHVCKVMERMITERLTYYLETRGFISKYQSGFRRGRNTMDPVLCLEHEVTKAQTNSESVVAVFFDIEKAYDMMWRDGLLIKLCKLGIRGRMYGWIMDFLKGQHIQVRIGKVFSERFLVENGTPQGSIVSPLLFSLMIDDVFNDIEAGVGCSLFADDGAIWKRGKNIEYIVKKLQGTIRRVEEWSYKWGFKFSVDKTKVMFFTRKRVGKDVKLKLYDQELERVSKFKFLGLWFDERLTWAAHIQKVVDKCKKVLNIMRCLVGSDWGADRKSLRVIHWVGQITVGLWVCNI
uniref:Reverse transcriptase domain-containing protein n=1 Tax=Oreochromis niloticus TaxID=8128 RepID=A0A669EWH7_ORENI